MQTRDGDQQRWQESSGGSHASDVEAALGRAQLLERRLLHRVVREDDATIPDPAAMMIPFEKDRLEAMEWLSYWVPGPQTISAEVERLAPAPVIERP